MKKHIEKAKAVIFDMDGVLFDTENVYLDVWSKVFEKYGYTMTKEIYSSVLGTGRENVKKTFLNYFGNDLPIDAMYKEKDENLARAIDKGVPLKKGANELLIYLKENKYKFKGNEALTRYDFAENLARSIDYIDLKKANKEDLNILEALMLEFSQELNKIGFDASTFNGRLDNINETIELLRERVNENEKTIDELKKRIETLENKN